MTMITPSYLGETIEYSSLHACRSTLEDPTLPERKTAAAAASSTATDFRYSATIVVFSSFLVVPTILSQASASLRTPVSNFCLTVTFISTYEVLHRLHPVIL